MNNSVILKRDAKDFQYNQINGSTLVFEPELDFDSGLTNDIEPSTSVKCTTYTVTDIATDEDNVIYSFNWQWLKMFQAGKTTQFGASPQDAFNSVCKDGLLPRSFDVLQDTNNQSSLETLDQFSDNAVKPHPAFFRVDTGPFDAFDNVRSAMNIEFKEGFKRSVGVGSGWYQEWDVIGNGVMPMGVTKLTGHEWKICGYKEINGEPMFRVKAWLGITTWMPRDVFNKAIKDTWGSSALMLSETEEEVINFLKQRKVSILQTMLDACYNLLKLLQLKLLWITQNSHN